ncbi:MAG: DUF4340 domain-containing protein [Cellvibrionaceae bacterium]|nr:DUF4340 domain-containing protein [Cellvibrionaceae bacterium]
MRTTIRNLALLFGAQVIFIVLAWSFTGSSEHKAEAFINLNFDTVTKVTITDEDGTVVLEKNSDLWFLPEYGGLQGIDNKLEDAVNKLLQNTVRWPAATSVSAHKRFEVDPENAQKTVVFYQADKAIATVHLGTSPGFKKVHARLNDADEVYALDFAQHELPAKNEEWFERSLLKFSGTIEAVKTDKFNLQKIDEQWTLSSLSEENTVDDTAVTEWLDRFSRLVVTARVDESLVEKITVQDPLLRAEISGEDSEGNTVTRNYAFYKDGEEYYIKLFGEEHLFTIAQYSVEPIVNLDPKTLEQALTAASTSENDATDTNTVEKDSN